jgi:hypothetical protein
MFDVLSHILSWPFPDLQVLQQEYLDSLYLFLAKLIVNIAAHGESTLETVEAVTLDGDLQVGSTLFYHEDILSFLLENKSLIL